MENYKLFLSKKKKLKPFRKNEAKIKNSDTIQDRQLPTDSNIENRIVLISLK